MVQRDQWDTYWGPKKINFLIRDIDDATMAGASAESCRFVVLWSPGGRLGSIQDVGNRLRRMRGRFHRQIHMATLTIACHSGRPRYVFQHAHPSAHDTTPWYFCSHRLHVSHRRNLSFNTLGPKLFSSASPNKIFACSATSDEWSMLSESESRTATCWTTGTLY
jgi:hypothetical protein